MTISRRKVLALPGAAFGKIMPAMPQRHERTPWYRTMRRCGQVNFNERDPVDLNIDDWLAYWSSLKINALLLNAGGIVAFYPTRISYHHKSRYLDGRDLFGDFARA